MIPCPYCAETRADHFGLSLHKRVAHPAQYRLEEDAQMAEIRSRMAALVPLSRSEGKDSGEGGK